MLALPPPPRSTLFPYTTLFRSGLDAQSEDRLDHAGGGRRHDDVTVLHGNLLVQGGRLRLATGGAVHDASRQRPARSEEHTSELQSLRHLVCRLLLEKKKDRTNT